MSSNNNIRRTKKFIKNNKIFDYNRNPDIIYGLNKLIKFNQSRLSYLNQDLIYKPHSNPRNQNEINDNENKENYLKNEIKKEEEYIKKRHYHFRFSLDPNFVVELDDNHENRILTFKRNTIIQERLNFYQKRLDNIVNWSPSYKKIQAIICGGDDVFVLIVELLTKLISKLSCLIGLRRFKVILLRIRESLLSKRTKVTKSLSKRRNMRKKNSKSSKKNIMGKK